MKESPAQKGRRITKLAEPLLVDKKTCITTIVSGDYIHYAPIFHYCTKKAYPEHDCKIFIRGNKLDWYDTKDFIYNPPCLDRYPLKPFTTASLRFVECEAYLKDYDYVLINDIDMIMNPNEDFLKCRVEGMLKDDTECYENFISNQQRGQRLRLAGIHFVTKDWWDRTRLARIKHSDYLKDNEVPYDHDEYMLGQIVLDSKLNLPSGLIKLWNHHGLHLGDYRLHIKKVLVKRFRSANQIQSIIEDTELNKLVEQAQEYLPVLKDIFHYFKNR